MIGIIGGMGPLATADFFAQVIALAGAERDEDHVPLLIQSDPRIPPRPAAILAGGESPLPALRAARDRLVAAGAVALAMPCHTAHHWHAALVADCPVPFLSIVEAACDAAAACTPAGAEVLVLGTRATLSARLFDAALQRRGLRVRLPGEDDLAHHVLPAIADVKAGRTQAAAERVRPVIEASLGAGAGAGCVLLACTELPIATRVAAIRDARIVDPTTALAAACIDWWRRNGAHRQGRPA